ncbi:MAG: hypothetical protein JW827_01940, partial [Spirochaetes bacterium]|nr:hypothetical protein [Spirochaetota bacterium]
MIITAKKLLFITLIFFLVSSWLVASKETISKQLLLEKQAVSSYYKADWDGYFHSLFQLIQADISSELAQFYMLSLGLEKNLVKNYDNLYPFYAKVLSTMPEKLDYFTYHLVLEDLLKHYLKKGLTTEARELAKKSGTLDKWNVTGGFVHTYYNDIDHDFYNIEKSLTFTDGERYIWRELPYGSDWGWVPFNFLLYPDSVTTAYAGCYIFFPREGTYIFWLTSNSSAKIFLNNHLILKNDSRRESYEMNSLYEVNMKKGWYHLLVKSSPPGSMNNFRLKVLDHRGAPAQGLTLSLEPQSLMEHAPDGKKITPGIYEYFRKEIEKQPFQTMNYLRKAILDFHLFSVGQAKQTLLKATLIDKKDAFLKYFLGRFFYYDYSRHYKTSELEISKTLFKEALNINKDFLRAREFLSLCYFDLDQTDKTYENLGPLLFESKQNRAAQPLREATLPLSKYFHKIDWKLLEIDQLDRLYKESRKTEAGRLTADFYSDYDMDKASLIYENIFSLDHQEHPRQWFDILLEKKEYDKLENQLTLLRDISAYSAEYYLYLAELCLSRGDQKNALEILEQLYKIHPYPDVLNRIAQIHYDFGQKEKALEYFVQSYRIKPSDLDIKDKIDYIKNRTMHENLESEYYPIDPQPLIERAFKDSSLNGDIKYYLDLMVIKVHPDGT